MTRKTMVSNGEQIFEAARFDYFFDDRSNRTPHPETQPPYLGNPSG
jgi:hypothetical protein